jgi:hypothetical protein
VGCAGEDGFARGKREGKRGREERWLQTLNIISLYLVIEQTEKVSTEEYLESTSSGVGGQRLATCSPAAASHVQSKVAAHQKSDTAVLSLA